MIAREKVSCSEVSVVIVNWNRRELLRRALESVRDQIVPAEIIVVDNGSSDGSLDLAKAFPETKWITNSKNLGFCAANNQGIRLASGEFIALLNNDAEADRSWIAALRACFVHPDIGMAASKIVVWEDPTLIDKVGHLLYPDGQNRGRGTGQRDEGQFDSPEDVLWPDGCAAMYRRSMLDEIGGFDEDLFAYGDDAELGLRARIAGWKCRYTPAAVVRHHRGSTLGKLSVRRLALIERNRVLLAVRHFPLWLLLLNPFFYAARICSGALASARGEGEAAAFGGLRGVFAISWGLLRGDFEALLLLPRTLWKRWTSRAPRRLGSAAIRNLIFEHRISLRELSTKAALR